MDQVVYKRPMEILDRRQSNCAGQHLVKIDQAEAEVEQADPEIVLRLHQQQTHRAKDQMKQVVRRRPAHQTVLLGYDKACDTGEHQQRRQNHQRDLVQGFIFHHVNPENPAILSKRRRKNQPARMLDPQARSDGTPATSILTTWRRRRCASGTPDCRSRVVRRRFR